MAENNDYKTALAEALKAREEWLERSELPKLKEELRLYHTGFASLYNLYLKKGLIHEDPYKQEAKIGELEVPSAAAFSDAEKLEQLTQRLANFDNQLDFLVNFYQFGPEFLNMDRIKRILGLVKYIDWIHLTPDSQSPMTKAVAEMTNQIKMGSDAITMSLISESLANLNRSFNPIMGYLKLLTEYQREAYKSDFRDVITSISESDSANLPLLKKKLNQAKPGMPFYPDLVDEIVKEDFSKDGPQLREIVLKKLQVESDKPKKEDAPVSFKHILIEGIYGLGGTAVTFVEILNKLTENQTVYENKKQSFMQKIKKVIQQMFNKEPDPIIYELEYIDPVKSLPVKEKINYISFRNDLERKIRTLSPMASRGTSNSRLEAQAEEQLIGFLERNIRELQYIHKILTALDEFFKVSVDKEDRNRIKGIKPELGTIKNAIVRANSKRHEYTAQKEEEEQLRRLGVNPQT